MPATGNQLLFPEHMLSMGVVLGARPIKSPGDWLMLNHQQEAKESSALSWEDFLTDVRTCSIDFVKKSILTVRGCKYKSIGGFCHFALSLVLSSLSDKCEPRGYLILAIASDQSFILLIETCTFVGQQGSFANDQ